MIEAMSEAFQLLDLHRASGEPRLPRPRIEHLRN
ncbi:hypothetical protein GGI59_004686 [Rhizobium lentis]|uniref:Uncharacterized protein n=2 Tax=Rhizobium lentis TaxID=1138194 RepID=A0A7W9CXA3_9HYPH|nr:hypothetical protein [Rhizobium lentis]